MTSTLIDICLMISARFKGCDCFFSCVGAGGFFSDGARGVLYIYRSASSA